MKQHKLAQKRHAKKQKRKGKQYQPKGTPMLKYVEKPTETPDSVVKNTFIVA